ncbi:glycosyltransferase family protein [Aeromonas media]|uniref:glycosyl transferase n=1 Tax=Aeromonas media TaxID=651 RepID=UPI0038D098C5
MKLVYISPVPWSSINQRPHFFAKMAITYGVDELLWVDPYPSRFPNFGDLLPGRHAPEPSDFTNIENLEVISAGALLPLEPIRILFDFFNGSRITKTINSILEFVGTAQASIVIGKPCRLSLALLKARRWDFSCYDAMDDFPSFYNGLSRKHMVMMEANLTKEVDIIMCSSHELYDKFVHDKKLLVLNACADGLTKEEGTNKGQEHIFGYIGTIASWFDWQWVIELASLNPASSVHLFGPVKSRVPTILPKNIILKGAIPHSQVMLEISKFDVAIIPFMVNDITKYVDPVKYYEYALAEIPIISTNFGEMAWHHREIRSQSNCPYSVPVEALFFSHDHMRSGVPRWSNRFAVLYNEVFKTCS